MTTPNALLELTSVLDRPFITFDGVRCELRQPEEFSVVDYQKLSRKGKRLDLLMNGGDLSDDEERELGGLMSAIVKTILIAGDDVHAKLNDVHRLAIVRTFMQLQQASLEPAGAPAPEAMTSSAS